jgi:hypothetical protein
MKNALLTMLLFFLAVSGWAQQSINSSGGEISGSGGSASISYGQIAFETNMGSGYSEAQGVQQPYEISVALGIEEATGINIQISAFPNPTADFILLNIKEYNFKTLDYQVYDVTGKLFASGTTCEKSTRIDLGKFPPSIYFLKVIDNQKEIKVFKIIKSQNHEN